MSNENEEVESFMVEPIFLRDVTDNTLPKSIGDKWNATQSQTREDAFVFLLDILMQESGFRRLDLNTQDTRRPGVYNMVYNNTQCDRLAFKLVCVQLGGNMVVHGLTGENALPEEKYQIKLRPEEFVLEPFNSSEPRFKQLAKLSRLFKDAIPYPLLQTGRQKLGLPQIHGLMGLVPEIQLKLLTYLTSRSLTRLAQTCSHFNIFCKEPVLWRRLYVAEFGKLMQAVIQINVTGRSDMSLNQDWKKFYKEKYEFQKEMRSRYGPDPTFVVPSFMDRPNPLPPHVPYVQPPFLGGDYDLNPAGIGGAAMPALVPRPRFDPIGPTGFDPLNPSPQPPFRPGRGGGMFDAGSHHSRSGGVGSRPSFGHFGGGSRLF